MSAALRHAMRNHRYQVINEPSRNHLFVMAAIAIANGFGVVFAGVVLANAVGLQPEQLILPSYNPPAKIIRLSSLNYSESSLRP